MWRRYAEVDHSGEAFSGVHNRKVKKMKAICEGDESALSKILRLKIFFPPEGTVYTGMKRGFCGEKVAEPTARAKVGAHVCIPCFEGESS